KIAVVVLKKAGCLTPQAIFRSPHNKIAKLIYSSRFYNQKTEKLKAFCRYLLNKYSGSLDRMFSVDTDILREELLSIKGIGRETADSIILYAGNKPSFVSDAYTKRFMDRYGLFKNLDVYEEIRSFFMANLPKDVHLYNEFHALIVHHGYKVCKAEPTCDECPVRSISRDLYCKLGVREGSS
ncbi:MAG: endonuclease III domain-containing protein, partial [Candidatus Omnitrophica bacterium]|nr:endonuclease III domain-containing protein [Candidatus Omnitrophota bacterium]